MSLLVSFPTSESLAPALTAQTELARTIAAQFNSPQVEHTPPPTLTVGDARNTEAPTLEYRLHTVSDDTWSNTLERKFSNLAARKAANKATADELNELDQLRERRRRVRNRVSSEEVIYQYRRRQIEAKLVDALNEYVQYVELPRKAKAQAK